MVGLAGLAPAIPCSQGRCVGYYATARNSCQATGCIRSPSGHDRSLAREVAGTKIGPHGTLGAKRRGRGARATICTRTGPVLSRMPLLLGYAGDALRRRSCTFTLPLGRGDAHLLHHAEKMEPRQGLAPCSADYESAASLSMLARQKEIPTAGFAPALVRF